MNSNNTNRTLLDDDLKFIPLNLQEPFSSKNSPWIPIINLDENSNDNMRNNENITFSPPDVSTGITPNLLSIPPIAMLSENKPLINATHSINGVNDGFNLKSIVNDSEYTSEVNKDELFCYSTPSSKCPPKDINNENNNEPIHMDILRNFDFSLDEPSETRDCLQDEVDRIFNRIREEHNSILGTLRAYKIPVPICTLIIKQIIRLTLRYYKGHCR